MCRPLPKNGSSSRRSAGGQSLILLIAVCAMMAIPIIGMASFEIGRLMLCKQQLQNSSDAAALTAVAQLASADNTSPTQAHQDAMAAALGVFKKNTVLGQLLTNSSLATTQNSSVSGGQAALYFEFVDPISGAVQPISSPNAKLVRLYVSYGLVPAFGKFLGLGTYGVTAIAKGAVPQLDVILCFDVSGSMDDQTPVTLVRRKWNENLNRVVYNIPVGVNGPGQGTIYNIIQPGETGTSLNATSPELLDQAAIRADGQQGFEFSEFLKTYYGESSSGLRSLNNPVDAGAPPGNCPPGNADTYDGFPTFTDLVVNIDGNTTFQGTNINGYAFPSYAVLVEAARGNLENQSVFQSSRANTAMGMVQPKPGYQQAYQTAVLSQLQPIHNSIAAAQTFIDILNTDTDCHFGFVSFDGEIGSSPSSTESWPVIDYWYGSNSNYPLASIPLNPAAGSSNYAQVNSAVASCVSLGSTNFGAAVHQAVQDMKAHQRKGSVPAIVLFTDGEPTLPSGPLDTADPNNNARLAAAEARAAGIPVYTIGLAQNPAIVPAETAVLTDADSNPTTGGMAGIAGHGGTFNLVTDSSSLRAAFEKIARHLVELVAKG
jgi:hypothetical protein